MIRMKAELLYFYLNYCHKSCLLTWLLYNFAEIVLV